MTKWYDNCGMGKDCLGYTKKALRDCCLYLPIRFDGSVNWDLIKEEEKYD